jgi:hypothetical protein
LSFFRFGDPALFLTAFWPHQPSKSDFLLLLIVTLNDFYIDDLDDKFSSYMCSSLSKTSYSARFFNGLIQIVWFSSSSRPLDPPFDQVHDSLSQVTVFEICHTDGKFPCMSAGACEIDIQVMIVWLIWIKSSFIIFWFLSSSRFSSLIFIKFIIQYFRCSFLKIRIQTENFSCMSISSYECDTAA